MNDPTKVALVTVVLLFTCVGCIVDPHDRYVSGVGHLDRLVGKTLAEIRAPLDAGRFVVLGCDEDLPPDLPRELRFTVTRIDSSAWIWSTNETGEEWRPFYSYSVESYREQGICPSYIYEVSGAVDGLRYIPRVELLIGSDGRCDSANAGWCDYQRDHPPFEKNPDGSWPYFPGGELRLSR